MAEEAVVSWPGPCDLCHCDGAIRCKALSEAFPPLRGGRLSLQRGARCVAWGRTDETLSRCCPGGGSSVAGLRGEVLLRSDPGVGGHNHARLRIS